MQDFSPSPSLSSIFLPLISFVTGVPHKYATMTFTGGSVGPGGQAAAGGSPPVDRGQGEDKQLCSVAVCARMARALASSSLTVAAGDNVNKGLAPFLVGLAW